MTKTEHLNPKSLSFFCCLQTVEREVYLGILALEELTSVSLQIKPACIFSISQNSQARKDLN